MKRRQLIEIHEQPWCPRLIRDGVTDFLQFSTNRWGYYVGLLPALSYFIQRSKAARVIDLCSGGGGPWLRLHETIGRACGPSFRIFLTDLFPNLSAFRTSRGISGGVIDYSEGSVNCLDLPGELHGFRTMFGSFHHFPRDSARKILQNAVDSGQAIGIFEMTQRTPANMLAMLAASLFVLVHTPLIRPFTWSRIIFTYLLPLIPLVLLLDGIVSCLRTYTLAELHEIAASLEGAPYEWEMRQIRSPGSPFAVLYAIGCPQQPVGDGGSSS